MSSAFSPVKSWARVSPSSMVKDWMRYRPSSARRVSTDRLPSSLGRVHSRAPFSSQTPPTQGKAPGPKSLVKV